MRIEEEQLIHKNISKIILKNEFNSCKQIDLLTRYFCDYLICNREDDDNASSIM